MFTQCDIKFKSIFNQYKSFKDQSAENRKAYLLMSHFGPRMEDSSWKTSTLIVDNFKN